MDGQQLLSTVLDPAEAYHGAGLMATVRAIDVSGGLLWQDTVGLSGSTAGLGAAFVGMPAGQLMVGRGDLGSSID